MRRRGMGIAAILTVGLLGLAACGDDGDSGSDDGATPSNQPKRGGTLVYATESEVRSLKPWELNGTRSGADRGYLIYDTLLYLDIKTGDFKGNLADSMTSTDGLTWTMKLRPNVRFTDNTPLDAEAVKFNIQMHMDPANGSQEIGQVSGIGALNVKDPLTLEIVSKTVNGYLPYAFTTMPGMMASPTAYRADPQAFGSKPVGAGPFMVDSFVRDSQLKLVRNPNFWDQPKPYLDAITVRLILDDVTRGQALAAGDVDVAVNDAPVLSAIKGRTDLKPISFNDNGAQAVVVNQSRKPGDDIRVRQAIALAFDQKQVNASVNNGLGKDDAFSCPPFTEAMPECNKAIWPKPDLAKAKGLIKQYTDAGNSLADTYSLTFPNSSQRDAEMIQQVLGDLGIKLRLRPLPSAEFTPLQGTGDYDFIWSGIVPFDGGVPTSYYRNLDTRQRFMQRGTVDPSLDKLLDTARSALSTSERIQAAKDIQKTVTDKFHYMWYAPYIYGIVGTTRLHMGDRWNGGSVFFGEDLWLDR